MKCAISELSKSEELRTYHFKGIKINKSFFFHQTFTEYDYINNRFNKLPKIVCHKKEIFVDIHKEVTNYQYKKNEMINFNEKSITITKIERDIKTGHYIVYTDFIADCIIDHNSEEKANNDFEKFKSQQLEENQISSNQSSTKQSIIGLSIFIIIVALCILSVYK